MSPEAILRSSILAAKAKYPPERALIGVSPLSDPLVAALFKHHRRHAPRTLTDRLVPMVRFKPKPKVEKKIEVVEESVVIPLPEVKPYVIQRRYPTMDDIVAEVAAYYRIPEVDIFSERRFLSIVRPRQVFCYLARTLTTASMPTIGRWLGGRDHTTILFSVRKIERLMGEDDKLALDIEILKANIEERLERRNEGARAAA
jgi:hypothetical protein